MEPLEECEAQQKQQHSPVCLCRGRFWVLAPLPLLFGGRDSPGRFPISRGWRERKRTFLYFPACPQGTGHPLPAVIDHIMQKKKNFKKPSSSWKNLTVFSLHLMGSQAGLSPQSPVHSTFLTLQLLQ